MAIKRTLTPNSIGPQATPPVSRVFIPLGSRWQSTRTGARIFQVKDLWYGGGIPFPEAHQVELIEEGVDKSFKVNYSVFAGDILAGKLKRI